MATHSSILAWRIPWTEEPGGPWSMGSQRVGHDWNVTRAISKPRHENIWIYFEQKGAIVALKCG